MQPIEGEWTPRESWTAVYVHAEIKGIVTIVPAEQRPSSVASPNTATDSCYGKHLARYCMWSLNEAPPDKAPITQPVQVSVSTAISRHASVTIQATGSFATVESSDAVPQTSGFVAATPIDAGAFVQQGAVIAKLDERDAKLRLLQARASEQQGEAAVRQARFRIGLCIGADFDPGVVPEVQAAEAAYESAVANSKLAAADAKRYTVQATRIDHQIAFCDVHAAQDAFDPRIGANSYIERSVTPALCAASLSATTGTVAPSPIPQTAISEGKLDGGSLSFVGGASGNGNNLSKVYKGRVTGGKINFTLEIPLRGHRYQRTVRRTS